MTKNTRFSPEVRQRTIRMVPESQDGNGSQWATIVHCPKDWLYAGESACLDYASMSGIPGTIMMGSPLLNVIV